MISESTNKTLPLQAIPPLVKFPLIFEIIGPSENPIITLSKNGTILGICKINATIIIDEKIIIDATPKNQQLIKINANEEIENIYHLQDFTFETFLNAPIGESNINYSNTITENGGVIIKFNKMYLSV